jgi:glycosyltransferase involved in cell wall biosynthesis
LNLRTIALKLEHHLFKKDGALLRKLVPRKTQAAIRRRMRTRYLLWEARQYRAWLEHRMARRKERYACALEPGLLSILTPVWDGTPLAYFRLLAESVIQQNAQGAAEWVVLDNGCRKQELLAYLATLEQHSWIKVVRSSENAGIIGGMRLCLEAATGRYILTVDSDDWLYPDCLQIVTWWIRGKGYPPILYTDEDKLIGEQAVQPYLKPDFDPVLLLNSAYIAHLGVIDRMLAMEHGAYADTRTEGSPDWDLFTRFFAAGLPAVHIPEVVYSWRMHPDSTADDAGSKPYIHSSQKAVLQRYLDTAGLADLYQIEYSPILKDTCDWWLRRRPVDSPEAKTLRLTADAARGSLRTIEVEGELICLASDDLKIDRDDWLSEAIGLFERFPDAVMVGGRIRDDKGLILCGGYVLGFGRGCDCPDRGRPAIDPGYFTQMAKQRSVSAVSAQFAVVRVGTLREVIESAPSDATIAMLGAWVGAWARRNKKRVIFSPYLSAVSSIDWDALTTPAETAKFREMNADLIPDNRFYPEAFGMNPATAYRLEKYPIILSEAREPE